MIGDLAGQAVDERPIISSNLTYTMEPTYNPNEVVLPAPDHGARMILLPTQSNRFAASTIGTYNPLHNEWLLSIGPEFIRYEFSVGVVTAGQQIAYNLSNQFKLRQTITNITLPASPAFTIEGLDIGTPFYPYGENTFEFTILPATAPIFENEITLSFDNGPDLVLTVSGTVGVLMHFRPQSKAKEKLEFKTNIITTRNGREQRISWRQHPRQSLTYKYEYADPHTNMSMRNIMEAQAGSAYLVPIWTEQRAALPITALDTTIDCDTAAADFRIGGSVFVYQDNATFETATIISIAPSQLSLEGSLVNDYAQPVVMPLAACYGNNRLKGNQVSNGPAEYVIEYRVIENETLAAPTFPNTYNGTPVILDGGWFTGRAGRRTIDSGVFNLDNKSGTFSSIRKWNIPKNAFEYGYHANTPAEVWDVRRMLHYLRGMQKSVWMPTMDNDFTQTQTIASGAATITVRNDLYTQTWGSRNYTDHVCIYDGTTFFFREITDTEELSADEELITLDSGFGTGYNVGELKIMRMPLVRLLSENIQINWTRAGTADIPLTFVEVQQ